MTADPLATVLVGLFDYLPDVFLFIKDADHRFRAVNRAEWEFHGCTSAAGMIGKRDEDFHPPLLARQYVAEDTRVMASGQPLVDQVWLVRAADGRPRWYACTKLPVRNAAGTVVGVAGIRRPHAHAGDGPGGYHRLTPAVEHVLTHAAESLTIADLAARACLSVSQFQREFRRLFRMTPTAYILAARVELARHLLDTTAKPLGRIAAECGFYDQSYFVKRFKAATGLRPLDYRRRYGGRTTWNLAHGRKIG